MKESYPTYHVVFIPAGCTGKAQPADVVMQRPLKCEITNQFLQWTTETMMAQMGTESNAIPNFEINTAMGTLKPKAVAWALEAWTKLRDRKSMILKGWAKIGLDGIFSKERQQEAFLRIITKKINVEEDDSKYEAEPDISSASDGLEVEAEDEECEEKDAVEEDEDEVDMDISISACLEEKAVVHGVRRSNRLRDRDNVMQDARLAHLVQESVYNSELD
jgi:hypothetical protein